MQNSTNILIYASHFQKFYRQMFQPSASQYGFTQIEIDILLFLHNNPAYNTARDICVMRGLAKSNVSTAVEALRRRGFLSSMPDAQNRRIHRLFLSASSSGIIKDLVSCQNRCFSIMMEEFSEEEFLMLRRFMKQMDTNILNALCLDDSSPDQEMEVR